MRNVLDVIGLRRQVSGLQHGNGAAKRIAIFFLPCAMALAYPFLLRAFNQATVRADGRTAMHHLSIGYLCLILAVSVPLVGLAWAYKLRGALIQETACVRARQMAYLSMTAPPLFVFVGVTRGLIGLPLSDETIWVCLWVLAMGYVSFQSPAVTASPPARLRVLHGISASLIAAFVAFHLYNHLSGLAGPDIHGALMEAGRKVYRWLPVEALLVGLLLFQVSSGVALSANWARLPSDGYRVLQIGSGIFMASFIVAHLNSALIGARIVRHVETNWAWASGAPEGLVYDAWNIRLLPHYGWGVFFVLAHLLLGFRQVMLAHAVPLRMVTRLWLVGIVGCGIVACLIMAGLLGLRI